MRTTGVTLTPKDAAAEAAIGVVHSIFEKIGRLDYTEALKLFCGDPDARYIENGVVIPLDAMKQQYDEFARTVDFLDNRIDSESVLVLAEDAVAVTVPVHFRIKAKGRPEYSGQYVWSGIVQRRNGTWQVVHSHESWVNAEQVAAAIAPSPAP